MKVMTVIGTRPEIIRLSRVIPKLDKYFDHTLVHTGQNYDYELNEIFFEDLELRKPDSFLNAAGKTACETIGNVIAKTEMVLKEVKPDALLVLGDTNSCLAAYSAKRMKIPIFHMEAGNRCFDQRVPEEINRKMIDHIADINMPYSDIAREHLINEGIQADRIIKTGSPMLEVLQHNLDKSIKSKILDDLSLHEYDYYVISAHREENIDSLERLSAVMEIIERLDKKVVLTTHPRLKKRFEECPWIVFPPNVIQHKPFNLTDFMRLETLSAAVLSDSGTISEESSILNFPALNIRDAHERPEAMEEASVMMTGLKWERIEEALKILENQHRGNQRKLYAPRDYITYNVSEKVPRIILSYTDYIRRKECQQ